MTDTLDPRWNEQDEAVVRKWRDKLYPHGGTLEELAAAARRAERGRIVRRLNDRADYLDKVYGSDGPGGVDALGEIADELAAEEEA